MTIQSFGPDSALADARFLRGLGLGLCLSPTDEFGKFNEEAPETNWSVVCGRSGGLVAFEIAESQEIHLPPLPETWRVIRPGATHLWFAPPRLAEGDPLPDSNFRGARILERAPVPGSLHPATGDRYFWGVTNPKTLSAPAQLPEKIWREVPKNVQKGFKPHIMFTKRKIAINEY